MRIVPVCIMLFLLNSCVSGKETIYVASTPAGTVVRSFLGIALTDSVDFIRWRIALTDRNYEIQCNYGVSKPNTNGFINDGRKIELKGKVIKKESQYLLVNGSAAIHITELNRDILHFADVTNTLLVGNGGWSYTLNAMPPIGEKQINAPVKQTMLADSIAFEGRSPCAGIEVQNSGPACYKLKWYFVLYTDPITHQPTTYKLLGTPWRNIDGLRGKWSIETNNKGQTVYQFYDETDKAFLHLLKASENILLFTGEDGKILVGNEDFSYTLNRRW